MRDIGVGKVVFSYGKNKAEKKHRINIETTKDLKVKNNIQLLLTKSSKNLMKKRRTEYSCIEEVKQCLV